MNIVNSLNSSNSSNNSDKFSNTVMRTGKYDSNLEPIKFETPRTSVSCVDIVKECRNQQSCSIIVDFLKNEIDFLKTELKKRKILIPDEENIQISTEVWKLKEPGFSLNIEEFDFTDKGIRGYTLDMADHFRKSFTVILGVLNSSQLMPFDAATTLNLYEASTYMCTYIQNNGETITHDALSNAAADLKYAMHELYRKSSTIK